MTPFDSVAEHAPDVIMRVDSDFRVLYANQSVSRLLELPRERLLGHNVLDFGHPPEAVRLFEEAVRNTFHTRSETRRDIVVEFPSVRMLFDARFVPEPPDGGEVESVLVVARDETENKRVLDELRRTREVVDTLLANAPTPIYVADPEDRLVLASSQFRDYVQGDWRGRRLDELFPPDVARRFSELNAQVRRSGAPLHLEEPFVVEGRERWFETVKFPLHLGPGDARSVGGVSVDVTSRHETELALRERERSLSFTQFALDTAGDAIFWIDHDARFRYVNRVACERLGYTADELLRMHVWDVDPDFPLERWEAHWKQLRDETVRKLESRHRTRTGETFPVEVTAKLVAYEGREYNCAFVRDLTDRRRAQDELRESRDRLARAQRLARLGDWTYDFATDRISWSDEVFALFGRDPALGPPRSFEENLTAYTPESAALLREAVQRAIERGEELEADFDVRLPDGRLVHHHSTIKPLHDADGRILQLYGTVQDITERKRSEQERAELLSREQRARDEAERANRAKDVFLATVSHELRTPLTTILAWAQMLRRGSIEPSRVAQAAERIERAAVAQKQLVSDLLDVSRIILGKLELDLQRVDPAAAIAPAIDTVRAAADERAIRLEVSPGAAGARVDADPLRLQQILWNLLSNAVKFTPSGGRVRVELERVPPGGPWPAGALRLRVRDTGRGITPEFLPHVFERFSQSNGEARRLGGLGLGLAISKQLVELHGGRIFAASEGPGRGSTFTVELPLASAVEERELAAATAPAIVADTPLSGLRVLLVDEDGGEREALEAALGCVGATLVATSSVKEALVAASTVAPDVLIAELELETGSAFSLVRRVREAAGPSGVLVAAVALSSQPGGELTRRALLAGYDAHLLKPVPLEDLVTAIVAARAARGAPERREGEAHAHE